MFQKGNKLKVSYLSGMTRKYLDAEISKAEPLQVKLLEGDVNRLGSSSGGKLMVDLCETKTGDTVFTAIVIKRLSGNVLELERIGGRDNRQYMRIFAWVELGFELFTGNEEDFSLDHLTAPEMGDPLPEMTRHEMKNLAQTDEASEAVLYLIQAVQALDRKLAALSSQVSQLIDKSDSAMLLRRKVSISGSGIQFRSDTAYDTGVRLGMRLRLPVHPAGEIITLAEVVRVDQLLEEDLDEVKYGIACRFMQIRERDRERIISYTIQKQREALRRMSAIANGF